MQQQQQQTLHQSQPTTGRAEPTIGRSSAESPIKLQKAGSGRARSLSRSREPHEAPAATGGTDLDEENEPARRGRLFQQAEGQQAPV